MAYILGFFTADGNMLKNKRGAHFIEFQITDADLLREIQKTLESNHKISIIQRDKKHKTVYRLQIGSKAMFCDLIKLGLTPAKSKTIKLPRVPSKYFCHFVRGYFDGGGNVSFGFFKKADRKNKSRVLLSRFTSGSEVFIKELKKALSDSINLTGSLFKKSDNSWYLNYSIRDSGKLFMFMYERNPEKLIYLRRKYNIYRQAGVA